ncbi:MAG: ATP-binding cassette domain-containing protein, partial [Deltaproteobacteria bacterium]|nr:ATP-binding cassette domain-containing protein [Deltaproteobacteria bacterium]
LGIVGPNGIGKTTLLKVLLGQLQPTSGEVRIAKNTRFAYFDQERAHLDDDATVMENVCGNRDQIEIGGKAVSVHGYLSRFLFDGDQQRQKVSTLSGGERARVQLAKFLLEPANVLLLDEPTNDLDVETLAALEDFLIDAGVTALFVTHDRYFLDRVADGVLSYQGDGKVVRYQGSYQAFKAARIELKAEEREASRPAPAKAKAKAKPSKDNKSKAGLTFTEAHELDGLMPLIEEAEAEVAKLDAELLDPDLYARRGDQVKGLQERAEAARAVLDQRIARWEQLEAKREAGQN